MNLDKKHLVYDGACNVSDYFDVMNSTKNIEKLDKAIIASMIDHTILKPEAKKEDIEKICEEAKLNGFKSVCVNPCWVSLSSQILSDTDVKICTVIGFPLGANTSSVKAFETKEFINNGCDEIDMVINIGFLKDKKYDAVKSDIKAVVDAAEGKLVKVILETCLLEKEEIMKASEISMEAGANFVKTSTGFSKAGALVEDIIIMRQVVGNNLGVKASGGIRTLEDFNNMVKAGATRIGASAGINIINSK